MQSTVLITGTNRGLGLSLVKQFLDQGFMVYSLSRSLSEPLQELEQANPDQLKCYLADVTEESQLAKIAAEFSAQGISLEILINNAAIHLDHQRGWILKNWIAKVS